MVSPSMLKVLHLGLQLKGLIRYYPMWQTLSTSIKNFPFLLLTSPQLYSDFYLQNAKTDILEVNAKSYVAIRTMENCASFTAIVQKRIVTTFLDVKVQNVVYFQGFSFQKIHIELIGVWLMILTGIVFLSNMIQAFINTCLFTVPTLHAIYTASSFIMYRFCSWNALHD